MLTMMIVILAFAGVYALISAMVGAAWPGITAALRGGAPRYGVIGSGASRRFNRA